MSWASSRRDQQETLSPETVCERWADVERSGGECRHIAEPEESVINQFGFQFLQIAVPQAVFGPCCPVRRRTCRRVAGAVSPVHSKSEANSRFFDQCLHLIPALAAPHARMCGQILFAAVAPQCRSFECIVVNVADVPSEAPQIWQSKVLIHETRHCANEMRVAEERRSSRMLQ